MRERAMWHYTHLLMPMELRMQCELKFGEEMPRDPRVDEALFVCRKRENRPRCLPAPSTSL